MLLWHAPVVDAGSRIELMDSLLNLLISILLSVIAALILVLPFFEKGGEATQEHDDGNPAER